MTFPTLVFIVREDVWKVFIEPQHVRGLMSDGNGITQIVFTTTIFYFVDRIGDVAFHNIPSGSNCTVKKYVSIHVYDKCTT